MMTNSCECKTTATIENKSFCPKCRQQGVVVGLVTLNAQIKNEFKAFIGDKEHFFCTSKVCEVVYYKSNGELLTKDKIKSLITLKDEEPQTPLCYCFKVLKGDVLAELATNGSSDVIKRIEEKMKGKKCFCEKANPKGRCCTEDIKIWLAQQGVSSTSQSSCCLSSDGKSSCCN
jgi:hypothetical protein